MSDHLPDAYRQAQETLATWHTTHPTATLAEIEQAVEEQIGRLRAQLMQERAAASVLEEHPLCRVCGATMAPRTRETRTLLLPGEEPQALERSYVVCPQCGDGLFPPG